jgi:imidazoleglycerol-phosphate dehydratase
MAFEIKRVTKETHIEGRLNLSEPTKTEIKTGLPFFDHMLTLFAFHAGLGLNIIAQGDLEVDDHHTVEDVGIVIGQLLAKVLEDKTGKERYGHAYVPMDESLARSVIDLSGRSSLVFEASFSREKVGEFALENVKEFLTALVANAQITLHLTLFYGSNAHHQVEALFKALGKSLGRALKVTSQTLPSTKGVL